MRHVDPLAWHWAIRKRVSPPAENPSSRVDAVRGAADLAEEEEGGRVANKPAQAVSEAQREAAQRTGTEGRKAGGNETPWSSVVSPARDDATMVCLYWAIAFRERVLTGRRP